SLTKANVHKLLCFFLISVRQPPKSTLFPTRRSSDLERVYFGGINKKSYSEKRGELAYTNKRVGKVKGYKDGKILTTIGYFKIEEPTFTFIGAHVTHNYERKLILRPLSDLTKEIEHNGWSFTFSEVYLGNSKLAKILGVERSTFDNFLNDIDYSSIQLLFKHHFDVFGLIDKGLAIDINTLKGGVNDKLQSE